MEHVKLFACQAKTINTYKNTKTKQLKCSANIYFDKQCLNHQIFPTYAQIKLPNTSPASLLTHLKTQTIPMKDEILFLYRKNKKPNIDLQHAHLQACMKWGTMRDAISQSIHINLNHQLSQKYRTIGNKSITLTLQQPQQEDSRFTFHPRVVNKTHKETALLQKGLNYNLHYKPANWIQRLGMEAETDRQPYPFYRHQIKITSATKLRTTFKH
jgi:hypothetical protein